MSVLTELDAFLSTRNGKIVLVFAYMLLIYIFYQSGVVCNAQIEKCASECEVAVHKCHDKCKLGGEINISEAVGYVTERTG